MASDLPLSINLVLKAYIMYSISMYNLLYSMSKDLIGCIDIYGVLGYNYCV